MPYNIGVMKLIDILEKDKDNLLTQLSASRSADKAVRVLENELDQLLMMYNEQCGNERERSAAAYMMQAVRLSLPLIDSVGETKIWETETAAGSKGKVNPLLFLFLIGALVCCGIGLLPFVLPVYSAGDTRELVKPLSMILGGLACAVVAGVLMRRFGAKSAKYSKRVEIKTDPGKVYRSFRNAILSVDQNLEEVRSMERWDKHDGAGKIDGHTASASELDLFSDLLAAAYSQDPEFALEKIGEIKYYLHKQQIEVVDYSPENAKFFDMMPGQYVRTIRPAMIAEGTLLRKGIASAGAK